nr:MAG TPA: hypothetical protein [Crassvirales sp.]
MAICRWVKRIYKSYESHNLMIASSTLASATIINKLWQE